MKKIAKITVATVLGLGTICGALRGYNGEIRTAFAENGYSLAMPTGYGYLPLSASMLSKLSIYPMWLNRNLLVLHFSR